MWVAPLWPGGKAQRSSSLNGRRGGQPACPKQRSFRYAACFTCQSARTWAMEMAVELQFHSKLHSGLGRSKAPMTASMLTRVDHHAGRPKLAGPAQCVLPQHAKSAMV